jgi:hypothetical protein
MFMSFFWSLAATLSMKASAIRVGPLTFVAITSSKAA